MSGLVLMVRRYPNGAERGMAGGTGGYPSGTSAARASAVGAPAARAPAVGTSAARAPTGSPTGHPAGCSPGYSAGSTPARSRP
ncbi:hypothetical protein BU197_19965 [Streptomyces sp. CBMA291]|nr:hypothetical protein [Streptomyces sp. CBMA291]